MRTWTLAFLALALAACGDDPAGIEDPVEPPPALAIFSADSVYLQCLSEQPAKDSASHFLFSGHVFFEAGGVASVEAQFQDASPGSNGCGGSGGSYVRHRRPGTYSISAGKAITFAWGPVPVPDTAIGWITSEGLSLSSLAAAGEQWVGSLRLDDQMLAVSLRR